MSSSIAGEIGCLSIKYCEARRFLKRNQSCRLSSDVISPSEARTLSFDVTSPDMFLC